MPSFNEERVVVCIRFTRLPATVAEVKDHSSGDAIEPVRVAQLHNKVLKHDSKNGGLGLAAIAAPCIHQPAPLLQQVATTVSGFDLVRDGMS